MSTASLSRKWLFWLAISILFFLFLFAIKAILLPFIVGILVAYFLDPAADKLETWGLSRDGATIIIMTLFFGVLIMGLVLLIPAIISQIEGLVRAVPGYIDQYRHMFEDFVQSVMQRFGEEEMGTAKEAISGSTEKLAKAVGTASLGLLSSGAAIINLASLIVIMPIVSFYLLRDWDRIVARIDELLPRAHAHTIRQQMAQIDETISGYVRGVVNVMLVLGIFYAVGLSIVGLEFAILIGLLGGIMVIIPYLGTVISGGAAVGMAYLQFDSWEPVAVTLAIFTAGQMLEGYVLTPKLVGDKIGLHPLWLIFGMLAGAALFGFVGILLAIPVTAIVGVLIRFAVQQYKQSDYYGAGKTIKVPANDA